MDVDRPDRHPEATICTVRTSAIDSCGRILQDVRRPSGCTMERDPPGSRCPMSPQRPRPERCRGSAPRCPPEPRGPPRPRGPLRPCGPPFRPRCERSPSSSSRFERGARLSAACSSSTVSARIGSCRPRSTAKRSGRSIGGRSPVRIRLAWPSRSRTRATPGAVGQLVVERDGVAAHAHHRGKRVEPLARGFVHQRQRVEGQPGVAESHPMSPRSRAGRG